MKTYIYISAILICLSFVGCKKDKKPDATDTKSKSSLPLPDVLQNKTWVGVSEVGGQYYQKRIKEDTIRTTRNSFRHGDYDYYITDINEIEEGWSLKIENEDEDSKLTIYWVDEARQLLAWEYTPDEKIEDTDSFLITSEIGESKKLPMTSYLYSHGAVYCKEHFTGEVLKEMLTVQDVDSYLEAFEYYRVEKSIATDLNKDGIEDILNLSVLTNNDEGYTYRLHILLGQKDGSYLVYSNNMYMSEVVMTENIEAKDGTISIYYVQTRPVQQSHIFSYKYDKYSQDWLLNEIEYTDRVAKKTEKKKINNPKYTLSKEAVRYPHYVYTEETKK